MNKIPARSNPSNLGSVYFSYRNKYKWSRAVTKSRHVDKIAEFCVRSLFKFCYDTIRSTVLLRKVHSIEITISS